LRIARQYYIGVDLGQRQDYSTVAVLEDRLLAHKERNKVNYAPLTERRCALLHLERLDFGTRYIRVVDRLYGMLTSERLREEKVVLCLDATGVGSGVFEMVQKMATAARGRRSAWLNLAGVIFTAGEREKWEGETVHVPKNELMGDLLLAMERREVRIDPRKRWTAELLRELEGMRRIMGETKVKWTSVGEHDDLVMALALAQYGRKFRPLPGTWEKMGWTRPGWERLAEASG
jgi:hypothetical protein